MMITEMSVAFTSINESKLCISKNHCNGSSELCRRVAEIEQGVPTGRNYHKQFYRIVGINAKKAIGRPE
jgi:hypothetical protein